MPTTTKPRRARGTGSLRKRGKIWTIRYSVNGTKRVESSHSDRERVAKALLQTRLKEIAQGQQVCPAVLNTSFEDLIELIRRDYQLNQRRSGERLETGLKHLTPRFRGYKAQNITEVPIEEYAAKRIEEGAAHASVNYEMAILKRMFRLARSRKVVSSVPEFKFLDVSNVRKGYFEPDQFDAVMRHLPGHVRPAVRFAYITGWRLREVLGLEWSRVDMRSQTVTLHDSKNGEPRTLPFSLDPELVTLFEDLQRRTRALELATGQLVPWVFHYPRGVRGKQSGQPVRDFRHAWDSACRKAGYPGKIFHDFRRTAVRNMERAGISRSIAMQISGHKTEAIYRRYAIVNEADIAGALKKLAEQRGAMDPGTSPTAPHASSKSSA